MDRGLDHEWLAPLGLAGRVGSPDLLTSRGSALGSGHASAIRAGFDRLGLDGYLCISGVPTVAFLSRTSFDPWELNRVHRGLWNQGLSCLLLVILPGEVRAYSLWRGPQAENALVPDERDRRLVETLNRVTDSLELLQLIGRVESGRFFEDYKDKFNPRYRVDNDLLRNLRAAERRLSELGLGRESARALILQTIFISYLEDRSIIDAKYFADASADANASSLRHVLRSNDAALLDRLFQQLYRDFNGNVFYAPCSFDQTQGSPSLQVAHLRCLAEFREGVDIETGQAGFWPYDFQFIPVDLISSIYDRFLNQDSDERRELGAYYTPRFLVDLVVDQVWQELKKNGRASEAIRILDPACGSAIFLVRLFQRMVEDWRERHEGLPPDWESLRSFLNRLHGWDKQESAVRIGVFSLYIALLEQEEPPTIQKLIRKGKLLPVLFGETLCKRDFFDPRTPGERFDVVIGNPPWVSRKPEAAASAVAWCRDHARPMPGGELAWAFIWKSFEHLTADGVAGLLLPAMGVLLNHSRGAVDARDEWLRDAQLRRVINFSDLRYQLFEGPVRPAALAVYSRRDAANKDYRFEYWIPKANRLLSATQMLSIASVDQMEVRASSVKREPLFWKRRMWATGRDLKLLDWLSDLPKLGDTVSTYRRTGRAMSGRWVIGVGLQQLYSDRPRGMLHGQAEDEFITSIPFLAAEDFRPWVLPTIRGQAWPTPTVRRAGFSDGFRGPHILLTKGIQTDKGLLRAAYVEESVSFRDTIRAIRFPADCLERAKLLTAILNSDLAGWFCFHSTASVGAERPEVRMDQLLELPFPRPSDLRDQKQAEEAQKAIASVIDGMLSRGDDLTIDSAWMKERIDEANRLIYEYFGLSEDEITVIEDTVTKIFPSIQPRRSQCAPLQTASSGLEQEEYALTLVRVLEGWAHADTRVSARVLSDSHEWAIVELRLEDSPPVASVRFEKRADSLQRAVDRVMDALPAGSGRNVQLRPDLKVFIGDSLYLVKPLEARYWMRSTALNDADSIAGDLLLQERATHLGKGVDATRR